MADSAAPALAPAADSAAPATNAQPGNDAHRGIAQPPASGRSGSLGDDLLAGQAELEQAEQQQESQTDEEKRQQGKPFRFGGVEFESQEKAEQNFRTLRGQHRAATEARKAAEGERDRLRGELQQYRDANDRWKAWYEGQGREGGPQPGQGQGNGQRAPQQRPTPAGINQELARREFEERGPEGLAQYLAWAIGQDYEGRLAGQAQEVAELRQQLAQLRPQVEPLAAAHQEQQLVGQSVDLYRKVASAKGPDGSQLFPELFDEQAREHIVGIWKTYPRELAFTPRGVAVAVAEYRARLAVAQGMRPPAQARAAEREPEQGQGGGRPRQVSRQSALTGSGMPRTVAAEPGDDPVIQALSGAGQPSDGSRFKFVNRRSALQ